MESFELLGGEKLIHLPISGIARRAHYILTANNLAGDRLLNNNFLDFVATPEQSDTTDFFVNESDPVWNSEKGNYYTKSEITSLLTNLNNSAGNNWVLNEIPIGAIDGVNNVFMSHYNFIPEKIIISVNGQIQTAINDFQTIGTGIVQLTYSLNSNEKILFHYLKQT